MLPTGETISPRSKLPDQSPSINQLCQRLLGTPYWRAYPNGTSSTRLFLKIAVAAQTRFKDADAIANAIGCAPLPEILIQNFLIPWLEQGFAVRSRKNRHDGPKSYCVTILQLSIGDKIAIDPCPVC